MKTNAYLAGKNLHHGSAQGAYRPAEEANRQNLFELLDDDSWV